MSADPHASWRPRHNPWLITLAILLPTIMEVLDTSVANVALPHIAGNLGATTDESVWVLTSYLVSNAIILPTTGWLGGFFGRKRFLMACIAIFTVSSALCGAAPCLAVLVVARVLLGAGGGALQPISQAVLLESFPPEKRGEAMAAFIMGIVVAPIIGPTLGGWITDNYSWRWIFYVNLPIGIMAFFAVRAFVEDPPWVRAARRARIDGIGFALLVVWVGTLQVVLDKGQEVDWFGTAWVRWASAIVVVGLVAFVIRQMTTRDPIVDLRVFGNRNFTTGTLLVTVLGAVLYGSTALLPLLLQTLMGYPALESGLALSPRGIGAFFTTLAIGRIVGLVDGRFLIAIGLAGVAFANELFARLNLQMDIRAIIWPTVLNGAALSFVFVPLTTTTMGTLRNDQIGNATGLYNLMRNLGGSIGISAASTMVARWSQVYQAHMVAHLTPYDAAFRDHVRSLGATLAAQGGGARPGTPAFAAVYGELQRQAAVRAYLDDFRTLAVLSLCCVPLAFLFRRIRPGKGAPPPAAH